MASASTFAHDSDQAIEEAKQAIESAEQIDARTILASSYYQYCGHFLSERG
jgi:hypothetical protein